MVEWTDLPKPLNVFTKRNAIMRDLAKNKTVQYYSANTKIRVVQKGNFEGKTYYRTQSAKDHGLDWAFEAAAFGLPNDVAPPAPTPSLSLNSHTTIKQKEKETPKPEPPKGGEEAKAKKKPKFGLFGRLFGKRRV